MSIELDELTMGESEPGEKIQSIYLALPQRPSSSARPYKNKDKDSDGGLKIDVVKPSARGLISVGSGACSLLNLNFNRMFCLAANMREQAQITHFSMQHDDIRPEKFWADILIDEMNRVGADAISAFIPLKDERGLTSCGVRNAKTGHIRRFSLKEVHEKLPKTAMIKDVLDAGFDMGGDESLMMNTGLWVIKFDLPWVEEFPGFQCLDRIVRDDKGKFMPVVLSEDWHFSDWANQFGLKLAVTSAVTAVHLGIPDEETGKPQEFRNDIVWGTWDMDYGDNPSGSPVPYEPQKSSEDSATASAIVA